MGTLDNLNDILDDFSEEDQAFLNAYQSGADYEAPVQEEVIDEGEQAQAEPEAPAEAETQTDVLEGQEEAQPEQGEVAAEDDNKRQKTVPHQALHQERERHKETKEELNSLREQLSQLNEKFSRGDERMKMLMDAMQQQAAPAEQPQEEDTPPDPEEDIYAFAAWQQEQIDQLKSATQRTNETIQQQSQDSQLLSAYSSDAQQFASQTPDFGQAYAHLVSSRDTELQLMGHTDPAKRAQMIQQEELSLARQALTSQKSPAELMYNLAKQRGYTKQEQPAPTPPAQEAPQQAAPQQAKTEQPKQNGMDKVANIAKGQEASKSLSGTGGNEADVITMAAIANMTDDEFDAFMSKSDSNKALVNKLLGQGVS